MTRRSSISREQSRERWLAFVRPHWPRLEAEVLTADEAKVLKLRLGVISNLPVTQLQIARRLGVSLETARKLEISARRKLVAALQVEGKPNETT